MTLNPIDVQYVVGRGCVTVIPIGVPDGGSVHDDNIMFLDTASARHRLSRDLVRHNSLQMLLQ